MRIFIVLILLSISSIASAGSLKIEIIDKVSRVTEYKNDKRVILILLKKNTQDVISLLMKRFSERTDEIEDRKLVFLLVESPELQEKFRKKYRGFKNRWYGLIGLDGKLKMSHKYMFTAKQIFKKVDSMPLRRQEVTARNN